MAGWTRILFLGNETNHVVDKGQHHAEGLQRHVRDPHVQITIVKIAVGRQSRGHRHVQIAHIHIACSVEEKDGAVTD